MTVGPHDALDAAVYAYGTHPGHRALHAKGTVLTGTFTATAEVARLSRAAHLQGATHPVIARVAAADLPKALLGLVPPLSYATCRYHAIHAFRFVDADGGSRYVRYTFVPDAGDRRLRPWEMVRQDRDYLQRDIRERLSRGTVRFRLELQMAGAGDPVDDPAAAWPGDRPRVTAGILELTGIETGREQGGDILAFDPTRLTDGIELSGDPVLRFRPSVYEASVARRTTD